MIERVLSDCPNLGVGEILKNAVDFRFQVLLSEILQDESGNERLVRHGYRLGSQYFYPASCVKLCAAVAALTKLDHLKHTLGDAVSFSTPLRFYSLLEEGLTEECDETNLDGQNITIAHEIRKLFLVSDNRAFNRLYDFVGHRCLNQAMWDSNLSTARIRHHLAESADFSSGMKILCNAVEFQDLATVPPKRSSLRLPENSPTQGIKVGNAQIVDKNLINEPMDFSDKNCMSLIDLQNLLIKVTRPDLQVDDFPINLSEESSMLLLEAMSQYPGDSSNPRYERSYCPDDFCKLFLPGLCRVRDKKALRIYNKVGQAFGFMTDNAYVVDIETGKSFFLTATIYTNANGILNDDCYEYDVAETAMTDLAEAVARAVWEIPKGLVNPSNYFDCTPSRQWHRPPLDTKIDLNAPEESTTNPATDERDDSSKPGDKEPKPCPAGTELKRLEQQKSKLPTRSGSRETSPLPRYAYFLDQ